MKQTEIDYSVIGNGVVIKAIRNAETTDSILSSYGKRLHDDYRSMHPCYYFGTDQCLYLWRPKNDLIILKVGNSYSKPLFNKIISQMKIAGDRLSKLIKDFNEAEIKTIKI